MSLEVAGKKDPEAGVPVPHAKGSKPKRHHPAEPAKVSHKLVIRKLPTTDYTEANFTGCVTQALAALKINQCDVEILHFMPGKFSRKRGPIPGTGFISFKDDASLMMFVNRCPSEVKFLAEEDTNAQPVVEYARYQKKFKTKLRPDKLCDTYAADADYQKFIESLSVPVEKPTLLEISKRAPVVPTQSAIVAFLKERGEKKDKDRRLAKLKSAKSTKSSLTGAKQGKRRGKDDESTEKAAKEASIDRPPRNRRSKKDKEASKDASDEPVASNPAPGVLRIMKRPATEINTVNEGRSEEGRGGRRSNRGRGRGRGRGQNTPEVSS